MNAPARALNLYAALAQTPSALFAEHSALFEDPATGEAVRLEDGQFTAVPSGRRIDADDGIPNFFLPTEHGTGATLENVTDTVKAFYEETPFPNYDNLDSRESLATKARLGIFASLLDQQVPKGSLVLEAGCGTGQLSNFLGMSADRRVFAGDLCRNSLRLAKGFADRYAVHNVAFLQMNLFRPPFRDASFDVVISNGVLHHTFDCEGAFSSILAKCKPGGLILIGLYNYYARLPTLWKAWAFRTIGPKVHFLDPRLRDANREPARFKAWFRDQYQHPHETRHSMDEVLRWYQKYGVDFVNAIPHVDGSTFSEREHLFDRHSRGSISERLGAQMAMLLAGGVDGGLFIMIGRKR